MEYGAADMEYGTFEHFHPFCLLEFDSTVGDTLAMDFVAYTVADDNTELTHEGSEEIEQMPAVESDKTVDEMDRLSRLLEISFDLSQVSNRQSAIYRWNVREGTAR